MTTPPTPADDAVTDAVTDARAEAGAVPLGRRLRDPRTLISFVIPILVVGLLVVALPGFHVEQLPALIAAANPWWLLAAIAIYYLGFPLRGYR